MGCDNQMLLSVARDELSHGSQPAILGHGVGFSVRRGTCGNAPRLLNDSFEITRGYHRQLPFPQFRHDVDAKAKTLRERLHRLD